MQQTAWWCRDAYIMSHGCGASSLQGQSWLRTIQRLNLAFFITAEYQGMFRRMQIQPYHILQLLHEFWITRNLEGLDQMRLQSVCAPYPSHARGAYSRNRRQSAGAPVRRIGRCSLRGQMHNPCRIHRGLASAARKIPLDRRHALFGVALTPTPHLNASYTQFPRNLPVIFALRGQQYNPGAP